MNNPEKILHEQATQNEPSSALFRTANRNPEVEMRSKETSTSTPTRVGDNRRQIWKEEEGPEVDRGHLAPGSVGLTRPTCRTAGPLPPGRRCTRFAAGCRSVRSEQLSFDLKKVICAESCLLISFRFYLGEEPWST